MLFRKMLRDMKLNKTQFISIFLMTVLALFIYSGVSSEGNGLQKTVDDYYEDTNFADAWIYGSGFSKEAADAVAGVKDITGVERRLTLEGSADFDSKPIVELHFVEENQISSFQLIEGEKFSINKDGIWLDKLFAKARGLKPGDTITISVAGVSMQKEIKGLILSPEYIYYAGEDDIVPVHKDYGYGYLSYQAFPKEIPIFYTDLLITSKHAMNPQLEEAVDQALGGKYSAFLSRKNLRSYMQFAEEIKEHKAMGRIFPIAFLAVAMLTIVTTMARLVNNQRTQIGILKAIGFKRRQILFHYVSYGLWISLVGTVIGAVLGPLILPYLFYGPMQTAYTLPQWKSSVPVSVVFMAVFSIISSTLITYFACKNVLKDTPSESLRPKAPKDVKHSFFDKLSIWKKLSFDTQWNLRDAFRCKGRSIMAIVGVLGCSSLLICAFGMQDTFDYIVKWNYGVLNQYEAKVDLEEGILQNTIDDIMKKYDGEAIQEGAVELKANGIKRSGELLVTDEVSLIHFVDKNRKQIILPKNQIAISYKIAELFHVELGDQISWHVYGEEKWNTSIVGAVYRTPFTQGITMTKAYYEGYGSTFHPTAVLTAKKLNGPELSEKTDGISKIQTKNMMMKSYNSLAEAMNTMVYVLMLAAVLLAIVVIYNLGVLAFTERQRELSTLKVIGFKTKKLRTLLLTQNIWLTVLGIMPGIPIGIWILKYIFMFVGEVFDFIIIVDISSYMYSILGTLCISILVNRLFSKRVKQIDMVSSLKGVE